MQTLLHITYYERTVVDGETVHVAIGEEVFDNIKEALIPTKAGHPVFLIKHFGHDPNIRWHVETSERVGTLGDVPMKYQVVLSKVNNPAEIYLDQALKLGSNKISNVLKVGTLVEVDFGFVQTVANATGLTSSNNQYKDTIQHGEMHKRRLGVVVKIRSNQVQIVPVTSNEPNAGDKTVFELSEQTLGKLHFYGTSGQRSWGLCNMIQTVSPSRLLPPSSFYFDKGVQRHSRHPNYVDSITRDEQEAMRIAILHAIGVTNYEKLKEDVSKWRSEASDAAALREQVAKLELENSQMKRDITRFKCVEEVAMSWAQHCGYSLEEQVLGLMNIYADCSNEVA